MARTTMTLGTRWKTFESRWNTSWQKANQALFAPRSADREIAFRERTIRVISTIGIVVGAIALLSSQLVFHDPWSLLSLPVLFSLSLLGFTGAALAVRSERIVLAGWLLVGVILLGGMVISIVGIGYITNARVAVFMLAIALASVVLARRSILWVSLLCIALSVGVGVYLGTSLDSVLITDSTLFISLGLFLRERGKESDDRLSAVRNLVAQAEASKRQAEEANRAKSRFLATMSHELRTPMNSVLGYVEIMLEGMAGELTPKQKEILGHVFDSGKRLLGLINDILDLNKIESGTVEVYATVMPPKKVVSDLMLEMQSLAEKRGIWLKSVFNDGTPEVVVCDTNKLKQILINLVGNAIKFTTSGGVTIEVVAPDANTWACLVRDTGVGMPKGAETYIFESFRQVDSSDSREHQGTGLGLAIVRQLTVMMGGNISVESELGKGSVFKVVLPRIVAGKVKAS